MTLSVSRRLTRAKIVVVVSALVFSMLAVAVAVLGLDIYLHKRYERSAGLNIWGYRGAVVGRKQAREQRIAVVGGSTAFGYGVTGGDAFPAQLERKLNAHLQSRGRTMTVVNLAYNNEGAYSFKYTLDDYEYLDYDLALLYTGYNDGGSKNTQVFRHGFPLFRLTGYVPILPLVFREKAMAIRYGGRLDDAYWGKKTTFVPTRTEGLTAAALEATAGMAESLERQLGRFVETEELETGGEVLCGGEWDFYCWQIRAAVDLMLSRGKKVLVVTQPAWRPGGQARQRQTIQRGELYGMLQTRYPDRSRLGYASMADVVDMTNASLMADGLHLSKAGNDKIAEALLQPVLNLLRGSE